MIIYILLSFLLTYLFYRLTDRIDKLLYKEDYKTLESFAANVFLDWTYSLNDIRFDNITTANSVFRQEITLSTNLQEEYKWLVYLRAILYKKFDKLDEKQVKEFVNYICWVEGFSQFKQEIDIEYLEGKYKTVNEKWREYYIRSWIAFYKSNFKIKWQLNFKNFWDFKYYTT